MNNNEEIIFSNNENNSENLNDTFFKNLLQLIKPRNKFKIIFGKKIIESINNKIK